MKALPSLPGTANETPSVSPRSVAVAEESEAADGLARKVTAVDAVSDVQPLELGDTTENSVEQPKNPDREARQHSLRTYNTIRDAQMAGKSIIPPPPPSPGHLNKLRPPPTPKGPTTPKAPEWGTKSAGVDNMPPENPIVSHPLFMTPRTKSISNTPKFQSFSTMANTFGVVVGGKDESGAQDQSTPDSLVGTTSALDKPGDVGPPSDNSSAVTFSAAAPGSPAKPKASKTDVFAELAKARKRISMKAPSTVIPSPQPTKPSSFVSKLAPPHSSDDTQLSNRAPSADPIDSKAVESEATEKSIFPPPPLSSAAANLPSPTVSASMAPPPALKQSTVSTGDRKNVAAPIALRVSPPPTSPQAKKKESLSADSSCSRCANLQAQVANLRKEHLAMSETAMAAAEESSLLRDQLAEARKEYMQNQTQKMHTDRLLDVIFKLKEQLDHEPIAPELILELQTVKEKLLYMTIERDDLVKQMRQIGSKGKSGEKVSKRWFAS